MRGASTGFRRRAAEDRAPLPAPSCSEARYLGFRDVEATKACAPVFEPRTARIQDEAA